MPVKRRHSKMIEQPELAETKIPTEIPDAQNPTPKDNERIIMLAPDVLFVGTIKTQGRKELAVGASLVPEGLCIGYNLPGGIENRDSKSNLELGDVDLLPRYEHVSNKKTLVAAIKRAISEGGDTQLPQKSTEPSSPDVDATMDDAPFTAKKAAMETTFEPRNVKILMERMGALENKFRQLEQILATMRVPELQRTVKLRELQTEQLAKISMKKSEILQRSIEEQVAVKHRLEDRLSATSSETLEAALDMQKGRIEQLEDNVSKLQLSSQVRGAQSKLNDQFQMPQ